MKKEFEFLLPQKWPHLLKAEMTVLQSGELRKGKFFLYEQADLFEIVRAHVLA